MTTTKYPNKPLCPNCGSAQVLFRQTTVHPFWCRRCGHEWTPEPVKTEKGK